MNPNPEATNVATLSGNLDASVPVTELRLPSGETVRIETYLLLRKQTSEATFAPSSLQSSDDSQVIPLIEERLVIGKQTVETGKVRLVKTTSEYTEQLNEPLAVRTFDIERIVINQPVDSAPAVRQQGDTTIYPVVEEQLILTKRLVLKEEVHVTQRDTQRMDTQVVSLHREHLTVEREDLTKD